MARCSQCKAPMNELTHCPGCWLADKYQVRCDGIQPGCDGPDLWQFTVPCYGATFYVPVDSKPLERVFLVRLWSCEYRFRLDALRARYDNGDHSVAGEIWRAEEMEVKI